MPKERVNKCIGEKKKAFAIQFLAELAKGNTIGLFTYILFSIITDSKKFKEKWSEYDEKQKNYIVGYYFMIGAAVSPLVKLLIIAPCLVNLFMQYDEYDYKLNFGGAE